MTDARVVAWQFRFGRDLPDGTRANWLDCPQSHFDGLNREVHCDYETRALVPLVVLVEKCEAYDLLEKTFIKQGDKYDALVAGLVGLADRLEYETWGRYHPVANELRHLAAASPNDREETT